jgi:small subunit ribosomal protein S11
VVCVIVAVAGCAASAHQRAAQGPRKAGVSLKKGTKAWRRIVSADRCSSARGRLVKKVVSDGIAHVHASFNNTITTTDRQCAPSWPVQAGRVPGRVSTPFCPLLRKRRPRRRTWHQIKVHHRPGPPRVIGARANALGIRIVDPDIAGSAQWRAASSAVAFSRR